VVGGAMTEANRILEMALDAYEAIGVSRSKQLRYIQKNWKEDDE